MAIFYVDFENVHLEGLRGITELHKRDKVFIYCRQDDVRRIRDFLAYHVTKADVKCRIVTGTTKNALDFELIADLFSDRRKGSIYYVVSNDKGFDAAIAKGMRREMLCFRINYIGDTCQRINLTLFGALKEDISISSNKR